MTKWLAVIVIAGCSGSKSTPTPTPTPTPNPPSTAGSSVPIAADAIATDATSVPPIDSAVIPAVDAGSPSGGTASKTVYRSDCSTTHPIARDPCDGTPFDTRGLKSCTSMHVKLSQPCKKGAASCYVEASCGDGRVVPTDFLECSAEQNGACFTRSSRVYKEDIAYLSDDELADLATQIDQLELARFRYKDTGTQHVGFIIEDEPKAAWVTEDGRRVDLYSLVSASIAAIQRQDARIRQLEHEIEACKR